MAIDAYLQFTEAGSAVKIEGETQDAYFKKPPSGGPAAFELTTWSFGASNTATIGSATAGAGAGKASFEPFKVTKNINSATPNLFHTCCAGGHYQKLTLWIRKAGANTNEAGGPYLEWQFKMAFVSQITWAHNDPMPTEEVTFVYGAIQFSYKEQAKTGVITDASQTSWSQVMNSNDFEVN